MVGRGLHKLGKGLQTVTQMKTRLLLALLVATLIFSLPQVLAQVPLAVQVTSPPSAPLLEVLSPLPGAKIDKDSVTVRYRLQPVAPPTDNFELILDDRDPVHTVETEYTFTGLTPGQHRLIVQAVDANNTPISGTRTDMRFLVVKPSTTPPAPTAALSVPPALYSIAGRDRYAPDAVSPLPLLLIIGAGVLVGGLVSARRTRPASR
jgi:hypothetical protein